MFAMNATLKPRAMAAYTGSSSNTSRERVLRVSSIGRLSDDRSSRPCDGQCKSSISFCAHCRLLVDVLIGVQRLDFSGHATLFRYEAMFVDVCRRKSAAVLCQNRVRYARKIRGQTP